MVRTCCQTLWSFCLLVAFILAFNDVNGQLTPSHNHPTTVNFLSLRAPYQNIHPHDRRTFPDWNFYDSFEFYGFWLRNEEVVVQDALLGAIDLMSTTMKVLSGLTGEGYASGANDPSFQRYFNTEDFVTFGAVLQRLLAVLGAPGTSAIRQCIQATKLQLIYGDGPGATACVETTRGVFAYYFHYKDANNAIRSYVAFCQLFFTLYKTHVQSDRPGVPWVDASKFEASIDTQDPTRLPEAESGASIVMHELLHWSDVTMPVIRTQIEDILLQRPVQPIQGGTVKAYRSFYSMKVKDPAWGAIKPPLENADNYVYTILEIFYRYRFGRKPWQDSPDLHGEPTSPHIPPAGLPP